MASFTQYGSYWGMLPQTQGRTFWVAPGSSYTVGGETHSASDDNDGLSPERAMRTIDAAHNKLTANVGDVLVILPGSHTQSSGTITLDVAGVTITGIPGTVHMPGDRANGGGSRMKSRVTNTATAGIVFTVTADDVEICYLDIAPTSAGGRGIQLAHAATSGADNAYIHDCTFSMIATAATSTYGITVGSDATTGVTIGTTIRNCKFTSGLVTSTGANGPGVSALGTSYGLTIESCTFEVRGTAAWARAINVLSAGSSGTLIRDCDFINSSNATSIITTAVFTAATIDGATKMFRCFVDAGTDVATATAIVDIVLAETYLASSGGGALANND